MPVPKVRTLFLCRLLIISLGDRSTVAVLNSDLSATPRSEVILAFSAYRLRQRFIMPRRGSSPEATSLRRTRRTSPIPALPRPLYPFPTAPRAPKRSRSPAKEFSPKACRRVHFSKGKAAPASVPLMVSMDPKPIAWDALATPAMYGPVQGGRPHHRAEFGHLCEPSECR